MLNFADYQNCVVELDGDFFDEYKTDFNFAFFNERRGKFFDVFFGKITRGEFRFVRAEFCRRLVRRFDKAAVNVIYRVKR